MNPDARTFLAAFDTEVVFGQVAVRRLERGFELRHESDRAAAPDSLATLNGTELRDWAQTAAGGGFRPLKSAPNLRSGWRAEATDGAALELLLHYIYPGAVADWFAAQSAHPPLTSYRQFTARQTGMYRITTMLDDAVAGAAIRACCHVDFCLKRRLWSVAGLEPDAAGCKSLIPCLEPCALLLEFARKVARLEQGVASPSEEPKADVAESDFDAPNNPRRVRFGLEKQALAAKPVLE
jgi:4Fe-4S iron-sulfur cluster binding domain/DR2241 stabilising domain